MNDQLAGHVEIVCQTYEEGFRLVVEEAKRAGDNHARAGGRAEWDEADYAIAVSAMISMATKIGYSLATSQSQ